MALDKSFLPGSNASGLIGQDRRPDRTEARTTIFSFMEGWHNHTQRRSRHGCLSPINHENHDRGP